MRRADSALWVSTAALGCVVMVAAGLSGCKAPNDASQVPPSPPAGLHCIDDRVQVDGLRLAGSGSCLALAVELASVWHTAGQSPALHVSETIGTRGAVQALLDGAIDVGLASRPLRSDETAAGVHALPLARAALAFVVDARNPTQRLTSRQLVAMYRGELRHWDNGSPVRLLTRELGDSGTLAIAAASPELAAAMQNAAAVGRAVVRYTDQEMRDALLTGQGALGILDVGIIRLEGLPLRALQVDGLRPDAASVAAGVWPYTKSLALLFGPHSPVTAARLSDFLRTNGARSAFARGGYVEASSL